MKAIVRTDRGVEVRDVPTPAAGRGEARIRVEAAGICGTDLAIVAGTLPTPRPLVLGHEIAGVVDEVGAGVDPAWVGKRVTTEINLNTCGECFFCQREEPTQCLQRKALGIDVDGGFARHVVTEGRLLHELPADLSFDEGTFVEPLAAAVQTFARQPLGPADEHVVVVGPGKLGQLIIQVAKARAPAVHVTAVGRGTAKLAVAEQVGADLVVNAREIDPVSVVNELTDGVGADAVVDASGNPAVLPLLNELCRARGKIYLKSTHGVDAPVNITDLVVREIDVFTSRCGPFPAAIELLAAGQIQLAPLVAKVFPLEQFPDALDYIHAQSPLKVLLHPAGGGGS